jgi:CspA family cold shock protein
MVFGALRHLLPSFPALGTQEAALRLGRRIKKEVHMAITGTVKFFNMDKGYGFISPDQGGDDAFVHISAVERAGMSTLQQDQRLQYELETGRNGRTSAVNLQEA